MEFELCLSPPELSTELPSYSPSTSSPVYSCELSSGERRLEHTPQCPSAHPRPTSVFIKKAGKTTIILNEQHEGATIPSYGRRALITGNLVLEQSETIVEVIIKVILRPLPLFVLQINFVYTRFQVKAKLDSTISEAGGQSIKLLSDNYTLWSNRSQPSGSCPSQIPFSMLLPATFTHNGETLPLPPSYNASFFVVPTLLVRSSYNIHIIISRIRHRKMEIWPKTKQCVAHMLNFEGPTNPTFSSF
jgi:hypothetical protein